MTNIEFFWKFHDKFGTIRWECGGFTAVFSPEPPLRPDETFQGVEKEPCFMVSRVGDMYVAGSHRFKTRPGYLLPHAWVEVSADGEIFLTTESPKSGRKVFKYKV